MHSALSAKNDLLGAQRPRISHIPKCVSTTGAEAIDLARMAGLYLDPWEEFVLSTSLGEDAGGRWAAFEVGLVVARQNGKGAILEARELAGLFLLNEKLIVHSAHEFPTSLEHFRRVKELIEGTPEFSRRVKKNGIKNSHGEEGIELVGGQRIRFRTRTKGGLRGFTGDLVVFDEAMDLPDTAHGAILPTLSAKSITGNPQVWYTASAVDQWVHEHGLVLSRVRERGIKGDDPALAYFEWSLDCENPEDVGDRAIDPGEWEVANPGLGIRISPKHVSREQRSMDPRTFAVERLGVGDWPATDGSGQQVISLEKYGELVDVDSKPLDPVVFAFDVTPDRSSSSIASAGIRDDDLGHFEIIERRRGTGWVPQYLAERVEKWQPAAVICDGAGPAASLLGQLAALGVEVEVVTAKEYAQACGVFYDACEESKARHLGTQEMVAALKGAAKRSLGDAWAWSRKSSTVDISPLVACTLAYWKAMEGGGGESVYEERDLLVLD